MPDDPQQLPPFLAALLASGGTHRFTPTMDVALVGGAVLVRMDVPGLELGDLQVRMHGSTLVVEGERRDDLGDVPRLHHERPHSPFRRVVPLNEAAVDPDGQPTAAVKRGVLTVTVPLREPDPGAEIEVVDGDAES